MLQALPLEVKIRKTKKRIQEWIDTFGEEGTYISFSGGKDSTVLLDITRSMYPGIEAVFADTGLEYPEIRSFVNGIDNVTIIKPQKNFKRIITEYGYPVISKEVSQTIYEARIQIKNGVENPYRLKKLNGVVVDKAGQLSCYNIPQWKFLLEAPFLISHLCCDGMKKRPFKQFEKESGKKAIIGMLAEESFLRHQKWIKYGCNAFDTRRQTSNPLSFWRNNDILQYIRENDLEIASVYGEIVVDDSGQMPGQININDYLDDYRECKFKTTGCKRTGCMFCLYGAHMERQEGRLERLRKTHPKIYNYVMDGGEFNNDSTWIPNNQGLGFKFVVDWLNEHGNLNIRY